jgi:hypothetical protein
MMASHMMEDSSDNSEAFLHADPEPESAGAYADMDTVRFMDAPPLSEA